MSLEIVDCSTILVLATRLQTKARVGARPKRESVVNIILDNLRVSRSH